MQQMFILPVDMHHAHHWVGVGEAIRKEKLKENGEKEIHREEDKPINFVWQNVKLKYDLQQQLKYLEKPAYDLLEEAVAHLQWQKKRRLLKIILQI